MSRYRNTRTKRGSYSSHISKQIPESDADIRLISTQGDRLDLLASRFYGSGELWWYIASANNLKTMNIPAGTKIRIPQKPKL